MLKPDQFIPIRKWMQSFRFATVQNSGIFDRSHQISLSTSSQYYQAQLPLILPFNHYWKYVYMYVDLNYINFTSRPCVQIELCENNWTVNTDFIVKFKNSSVLKVLKNLVPKLSFVFVLLPFLLKNGSKLAVKLSPCCRVNRNAYNINKILSLISCFERI